MSPAKRPERSGDQKVESSPEQARERKAERLREQHAAVDAVRSKVEAVHTLIGIRPPPEVVGTLFRTDPEFALSLFNVDAYRDDERVAMIGKLLKPVGGSYVSIQYHWYDRDKRCQRSHSDYAAALAARRKGQDVSYSTSYSSNTPSQPTFLGNILRDRLLAAAMQDKNPPTHIAAIMEFALADELLQKPKRAWERIDALRNLGSSLNTTACIATAVSKRPALLGDLRARHPQEYAACVESEDTNILHRSDIDDRGAGKEETYEYLKQAHIRHNVYLDLLAKAPPQKSRYYFEGDEYHPTPQIPGRRSHPLQTGHLFIEPLDPQSLEGMCAYYIDHPEHQESAALSLKQIIERSFHSMEEKEIPEIARRLLSKVQEAADRRRQEIDDEEIQEQVERENVGQNPNENEEAIIQKKRQLHAKKSRQETDWKQRKESVRILSKLIDPFFHAEAEKLIDNIGYDTNDMLRAAAEHVRRNGRPLGMNDLVTPLLQAGYSRERASDLAFIITQHKYTPAQALEIWIGEGLENSSSACRVIGPRIQDPVLLERTISTAPARSLAPLLTLCNDAVLSNERVRKAIETRMIAPLLAPNAERSDVTLLSALSAMKAFANTNPNHAEQLLLQILHHPEIKSLLSDMEKNREGRKLEPIFEAIYGILYATVLHGTFKSPDRLETKNAFRGEAAGAMNNAIDPKHTRQLLLLEHVLGSSAIAKRLPMQKPDALADAWFAVISSDQELWKGEGKLPDKKPEQNDIQRPWKERMENGFRELTGRDFRPPSTKHSAPKKEVANSQTEAGKQQESGDSGETDTSSAEKSASPADRSEEKGDMAFEKEAIENLLKNYPETEDLQTRSPIPAVAPELQANSPIVGELSETLEGDRRYLITDVSMDMNERICAFLPMRGMGAQQWRRLITQGTASDARRVTLKLRSVSSKAALPLIFGADLTDMQTPQGVLAINSDAGVTPEVDAKVKKTPATLTFKVPENLPKPGDQTLAEVHALIGDSLPASAPLSSWESLPAPLRNELTHIRKNLADGTISAARGAADVEATVHKFYRYSFIKKDPAASAKYTAFVQGMPYEKNGAQRYMDFIHSLGIPDKNILGRGMCAQLSMVLVDCLRHVGFRHAAEAIGYVAQEKQFSAQNAHAFVVLPLATKEGELFAKPFEGTGGGLDGYFSTVEEALKTTEKNEELDTGGPPETVINRQKSEGVLQEQDEDMLARRWGNILQIPVSSADIREAAASVDGVRIDIYGQESHAHYPEYLLDPSMFIPQKTGIEILRRGKELAPAARKILEQLYIRGLQLMRELESRWRKRRT